MELNKAIKNRWSPRAFSDKVLTNEMLELLFEAARWAPSAMNEQPWQYFYAKRNNEKTYNNLLGILTGNNPEWAKNAQVLIVSIMKKITIIKVAPIEMLYMIWGAANISIAIQAAEMGLQVHQMAGFDKQRTIEYLKLNPENFEPVTIFAVGYPGNPEQLSEDLKKRELEIRTRKNTDTFVFKL